MALAVLAIVGGVLHYFARPGESTGSRTSTGYGIGLQSAGIPYGSTRELVLRRLGHPTRQEAACWIYSANDHKIHGRPAGPFVDAMKFCFANRVVTYIYSHYEARTFHKKHFPPEWAAAITIQPHGQPK